jgi:choline kinase
MKCLILAAGHGSRLRALSDSKPLTPVAGSPLIEHVIRAAAAAGAREFVVVTGHQAERVEAFLATLTARLGLSIEPARTEDWDRPNGHSVLAGAAAIDGDYLLLMADHLFEPEVARRLLNHAPSPAALTLAVDRDLTSPLLDLDDATKVEVGSDGEIVRIGKKLAGFNAIDTGIFLATPALAAAIGEDIVAGGGGSLSEGVQRLANRRQAFTLDAGGSRWIDIDDPRTLALAAALVGPGPAELRDNAA